MRQCASFLAAATLIFLGVEVSAQDALIDDVEGFIWESGGFPPSVPGDQLFLLGTIGSIDESLPGDPSQFSYTLYVRDLVSIGEFVFGTIRLATYSGGTLSIYIDELPSNHDYGTNPPNATAPSSFTDGLGVFLEGLLPDATLALNMATQSGSFSGFITLTGGEAMDALEYSSGHLLLGVDVSANQDRPEGYDLSLNGEIYIPQPGATEPSSWGAIKALYH